MASPSRKTRELHRLLEEFAARAAEIWNAYSRFGPGKVDCRLYELAEPVARGLSHLLGDPELDPELANLTAGEPELWRARIALSITTSDNLARRCVFRSEGLCFVAGESGLIPRRDLHDAFEASLGELRRACAELDHGRAVD